MSEPASKDHEHGLAHVMPISVLVSTFLALIFFTVVTVGSSYLTLGNWDLPLAMVIATIKAALVAVYFMHLRYDKVLNTLFVLFSLAFVALFLGMTLADSDAYQPEIQAVPVAPAAPA
jgi:cytochrome c oxidase subunit IV